MNLDQGDYLTFENGKEFHVINTINYNKQKYLYLANDESGLEMVLGREIKDKEGNVMVESLADKKEIKEVSLAILKDMVEA